MEKGVGLFKQIQFSIGQAKNSPLFVPPGMPASGSLYGLSPEGIIPTIAAELPPLFIFNVPAAPSPEELP